MDNIISIQRPKFLGLRVSALVEIICFFLFLTLVAFFLGISPNYFTLSPHPFWIAVILISSQYGTNEGLIAASIASFLFLIGTLPQRDVMQDLFEYFFFLAELPILWFVTAVILGELRLRHIRERDELCAIALEAQEKEKSIAEAYTGLKKLKESLEMRVASEMETALMTYESFKKLAGTKNLDEILEGSRELIKTLTSPEKFSIFLLEGDELKLKIADGWEENAPYARSFKSSSLLFQEIMARHRVLSIINVDDFKILEREGVLAVPLMAEDRVLGMIKIEQIPFIRLRMTTIESLRSIGAWLGTAYINFMEHHA